jgi:hypothetical protein
MKAVCLLYALGCLWLTGITGHCDSTVTLAWDANPEADITGYKVKYGFASRVYSVVVPTGKVTEITIPNMVDGTLYFFAVSAVNAENMESLDSDEISYVVPTNDTDWPLTYTTAVVYVDSEEANGYDAFLAIDKNPNTFWHTAWKTSQPPFPHEIQIDLGGAQTIKGFTYLPRQDTYLQGTLGQYEFYASVNRLDRGFPVASGTFAVDHTLKTVYFPAVMARYVILKGLSDPTSRTQMAAAEIAVITDMVSLPKPNGPKNLYLKKITRLR